MRDKQEFDADKLVLEALREKPEYTLPDNFALNLSKNIGRRFAWQQNLKEFVIYLTVIAGIVMFSAVMAFVLYDADLKIWLDFLLSNRTLVFGTNLLLVFVLFVDRVLLRYFMYRYSER